MGRPEFIVAFVLKWVKGMNAGEWEEQTHDLETLIGHEPTAVFDFFRDDYLRSSSK